VIRGFLEDAPFVFTGPEYWNALGLGSTAMFPLQLVYNTKRSGEFTLGGRRYLLRRVKFPRRPTAEWYAIDLIEHRAMVGIDREILQQGLITSLGRGELDRDALRQMARHFGTKDTQQLVETAIVTVGRPAHTFLA